MNRYPVNYVDQRSVIGAGWLNLHRIRSNSRIIDVRT